MIRHGLLSRSHATLAVYDVLGLEMVWFVVADVEVGSEVQDLFFRR